MTPAPRKRFLKAAPAWIQKAARDPLKVHRLAVFKLPAPNAGHRLWFVETMNYKAGWFIDGARDPALISEPSRFRAARPHE